MKNYATKRARGGKAAYRTPSRFIYKKVTERRQIAPRAWDLATRLEHRRVKGKQKRK